MNILRPVFSVIQKVRRDKLRVVVGSLKEANEIASCKNFTNEYRVYVPSRSVEIDGVVTEPSLSREDFIKYGVGRFKDPRLYDVKILDCKPMHTARLVEGETKYIPTNSFRESHSPVRLCQTTLWWIGFAYRYDSLSHGS